MKNSYCIILKKDAETFQPSVPRKLLFPIYLKKQKIAHMIIRTIFAGKSIFVASETNHKPLVPILSALTLGREMQYLVHQSRVSARV